MCSYIIRQQATFSLREATRGEKEHEREVSRFSIIVRDSQVSMCQLHLSFTSSYLSSFSLSLKSMSRFRFTISHVLNEVYLEFVLSEN